VVGKFGIMAKDNKAGRLQNHLFNQLKQFDLELQKMRLIQHLISSIDSHGYFHTNPEEIALTFDPSLSSSQINEALTCLRALDPPGIGATDLKECLLLQLTSETPHNALVRLLITNHLLEIQQENLTIIQEKTNYPLTTIEEAIGILKHFNPRPGAKFSLL
jgi:RNA polymerase sigma-54 factor